VDKDERKIARERSKKNIRDFDPAGFLGDLECFEEVHDMVQSGAMVRDIATFIHGRNEATHVSRKGLCHALMRYKRYVLGDQTVSVDSPGSTDDLAKENPASVALVLRDQFFAMRDRIAMETELEMTLRKLFPTTVKEYMASSKMAKDLVHMYKEFDMLDAESDTGGRHRSSFKGPVDMEKVIVNPESRQKLLGIAELITKNPDMFDDVISIDNEKRNGKKVRRKKKKHLRVIEEEDERKAQ
jgi:hypothetical protein